MSYKALLEYGWQATEDNIFIAEKQLAKMYRDSYKVAQDELSALYAKLGPKLDLDEARKYKRLENTIDAISTEYRSLTGKSIELAGDTSVQAVTGAYNSVWFATEQAKGAALEFGLLPVDAIRASVYSEISGATFTKRFGKLYVSTIDRIAEDITRGLATGAPYRDVAAGLKDAFNGSFYNAMRVVRTEAGRNFSQGSLDAYDRGIELGIDMRKQWSSTFDGRTRPDHARLNGKLADDEGFFHIGSDKAPAPRMFGVASQDIQCRCALVYKIAGADGAPDWTYNTWKKEYAPWLDEPPRDRYKKMSDLK